MLPGWDSIESTAAYAKRFTFAGFGALFLLGLFEVLAYVYSAHKDTLASAGRHLNPVQEQALRTSLLPFSGERLDMYVYANDDDAIGIANQLATALGPGSKWEVTVFGGLAEELRVVAGLAVETTASATPRDTEAAQALVSALVAQHLRTFGPGPFNPRYDTSIIPLPGTPGFGRIPAPIRLTVGRRAQ